MDGWKGRNSNLYKKGEILEARDMALQEICFYQKCVVLLIPMWVFCCLVKEIGQNIKSDLWWQSSAILTLQNGVEDYLVRLLEDTNLCALHAHWHTIMPKDMHLVCRIYSEWK